MERISSRQNALVKQFRDIAQGVVTGFAKGLIDIPFAPSVHNRGEVMTTRDVEGAVRFLSFGNLQFDRETRQFHARTACRMLHQKPTRVMRQAYPILAPETCCGAVEVGSVGTSYFAWLRRGEAAVR